MHYRAEIDGLRAIAVIPVILFHAGFSLFSGGFVGVDVFFVISGYLITTIIIDELAHRKFSIVTFYERRARRILPALFLVLLSSLPFAWFWLLPQDMKSFSQSLAAVSVFASNILFWRTSGYFDTAAELKPLLHTWSLAVEEQFYVVFPLFLFFAWRWGKRWVLVLMASVAALSLALAHWASTKFPDPAFYLLPTRGWELLIGAFVAFYLSNRERFKLHPSLSELGGLLGVTLLGYAIFVFDKKTPVPSLYTLAPTIGTALIILCANSHNILGKLLSSRFFVLIGLISYSAYLWHQPMFAFARHQKLGEPTTSEALILVVASIIVAYFSWKYIESPFRDKSKVSRRGILTFSVLGSILFSLFGLIGYFTNGLEVRLSKDKRDFLRDFDVSLPERRFFKADGWLQNNRIQCDFYNIVKYMEGNSTTIPVDQIAEECYRRDHKKHAVFIWGDSHAFQLSFGLRKTIPNDWEVLQVTGFGCPAKLNAMTSSEDNCEQSNWFAYKTIKETKPDVVIIAQRLNHSVDQMSMLSDALKTLGVKKTFFIGPTPQWAYDLPKLVAYRLWDSAAKSTLFGLNFDVINRDKSLKETFKKNDFSEYVSLIDYFCDDSGCRVYFGEDRKVGLTSWDSGHLRTVASYHLAKDFLTKKIVSSVQ